MNDAAFNFFTDDFARVGMAREEGQIKQTVAFITAALKLDKGGLVFDQCCGTGDISLALARQGFRTIGVDMADNYTATAAARARAAGLDCRFEKGDATLYRTPEPCAGAFNLWTSFGYSEDDAVNIKMIECAVESLQPGAGYLLDFMNSAGYDRGYGPVTHRYDHAEGVMTWESHIDTSRDMVVKGWHFKSHDGKVIKQEGFGVRLYMPDQLSAMFARCGLEDIRQYGDMTGTPYKKDSKRCITVGFKALNDG